MPVQNVDVLLAGAIGALAMIFMGAMAGLIIICRRQRVRSCCMDEYKPEVCLIPPSSLDLELTDVDFGFHLEDPSADGKWIDDVKGLIPHCLAVLKSCHYLTERFTALAAEKLATRRNTSYIIEVARRLPPRIDDMVRSMYPPIDARLLEAHSAALVMAVGQLALLAQDSDNMKNRPHWIDQGLADIDKHLLVLREAALAQEIVSR